MKFIITLFFFLLTVLFSKGQKMFFLEIQLSPIFINEILRIDFDNGKESISKKIKIINNKFSISDTFYSTYVRMILQIGLKKEKVTIIFYLKDDIAQLKYDDNFLNTPIDFISKLKYKNLFYLEEEKEYHNYYAEEYANLNKFASKYRKVSKMPKDSLYQELQNMKKILFSKKLEYLLNKPSSYVSFYFFKTSIVLGDFIKPDSLLHLFNNYFKDVYSDTYEGKMLIRFLLGKSNSQVGKKALSFMGISPVNNDTILLSKYQNRYKLIIFWASWCGPCIKEIPVLKKIYTKYSKNIEFISISSDNDLGKCLNAIKKYKIFWLNLLDNGIVQEYGIAFVPQILLLNKDNLIIYSSTDSKDGIDLKVLQDKLSSEFIVN